MRWKMEHPCDASRVMKKNMESDATHSHTAINNVGGQLLEPFLLLIT